MEQQWNDIDWRKIGGIRRVCPSAIFSTTNPTLTTLGMNLDLHCEKLATA
jgi:hypothetical protein